MNAPRGVTMSGLVVCVAVLLAATVFGVLHRRAEGRLRALPGGRPGRARGAGAPGSSGGERRLDERELGGELGRRATLVQFSSPYCAPCRTTRRTLAEVAERLDGVRHVELDVAERLDLVRELNILKTPTVLVLDPSGRMLRRASGQPRKADLLALLAAPDAPGPA